MALSGDALTLHEKLTGLVSNLEQMLTEVQARVDALEAGNYDALEELSLTPVQQTVIDAAISEAENLS